LAGSAQALPAARIATRATEGATSTDPIGFDQFVPKHEQSFGGLDGQAYPARLGLDHGDPDAFVLKLVEQVVDRGIRLEGQAQLFMGSSRQYQPAHTHSFAG